MVGIRTTSVQITRFQGIFRKFQGCSHFAEIRENLLFVAILAVGIVGVIQNTKHDNFSLECEDNRATLECIRPVASKKPLDFAKSNEKNNKICIGFPQNTAFRKI